jgi:ABC-type sugar transport system substrate-binding protein
MTLTVATRVASFERSAFSIGEAYVFLVGTPVFKTGEGEHLVLAGSIPVRLRCVVVGSLALVLAGCGGPATTQPQPVAPPAVVALVGAGGGPAWESALGPAAAQAQRRGLTLRPELPSRPGARAQAEVFTRVLAQRPRAVVLLPVDYQAALPYLRLAHDQGIFVVAVDEPPDIANPTFVVSFVSSDSADVANRLVPLLTDGPSGGEVLVLRSSASRGGAEVSAAVTRQLPTGSVTTEVLGTAALPSSPADLAAALARHLEARDVVLADAGVVSALGASAAPSGRRLLAATRGGGAEALLAQGRVHAVVGPRLCELVQEGVRMAAAAAVNDAASVRQVISLSSVAQTGSSGLDRPCQG